MEATELKWEHTIDVLNRYGELLVTRYQTYVPEASGKLVNSVRYELKTTDRTFEIGLWLEDYWYYVENGRKAGKFPPIEKIKDWITVKPIIPRPMKNGKLPTEDQLAFLIARKIAREGTLGTHPLERAVEDVNSQMLMSLKEAIIEDIGESLTTTLITLNNLGS